MHGISVSTVYLKSVDYYSKLTCIEDVGALSRLVPHNWLPRRTGCILVVDISKGKYNQHIIINMYYITIDIQSGIDKLDTTK